MDYEALYRDNDAFKAYVDKYAVKHRIPAKEALTHYIVKEYGKQADGNTCSRKNNDQITRTCDS